jgi:hypothetical protein
MWHTVLHVSTQLVLSYPPTHTSKTLHGVVLSVQTDIFGEALNTPNRLCIMHQRFKCVGSSFAYYHRSFFNYILYALFSRLFFLLLFRSLDGFFFFICLFVLPICQFFLFIKTLGFSFVLQPSSVFSYIMNYHKLPETYSEQFIICDVLYIGDISDVSDVSDVSARSVFTKEMRKRL